MFVFIFSVRSQYWSCRVKVLAGASTGGKEGIWATELVCYLAVECAGVIRLDHPYRRSSSRILETVVQSISRKISCGLLSVVEVLCKCLFAVKTVFLTVRVAKLLIVLVVWIQEAWAFHVNHYESRTVFYHQSLPHFLNHVLIQKIYTKVSEENIATRINIVTRFHAVWLSTQLNKSLQGGQLTCIIVCTW